MSSRALRPAFSPAAGNFDEDATRLRRAMRRAAEEQVARDADEAVRLYATPKPPPAVSFRPAPRQEDDLNWGKAIGDALGKIGGAVVGKLTEKPEPAPSAVVHEGMHSIPAPGEEAADDLRRVLALRPGPAAESASPPGVVLKPASPFVPAHEAAQRPSPAQVGDQFADVGEIRNPVETADDARRRLALVPEGAAPRPTPPPVAQPPALRPAAEGVSPADVQAFGRMLRPAASAAPEGDPLTAPLPEMPPEAVEARRRQLKPALVNTGDERADLERYQRALAADRDPGDRNGRLVSALKKALQGAAEGARTTGTWAGAAGGALAGGAYGAARPNWDERDWRDAEGGRVAGQLKTLDEQTKRALDEEETRADRLHADDEEGGGRAPRAGVGSPRRGSPPPSTARAVARDADG